MERSNTRKTNKNKSIKPKNQTTLLTNITQKTPELQETKNSFFHRLKQNKKQDKNRNPEQKQGNTKNNANIETERLKHTP